MQTDTLYRLNHEDEIASPALIYYPELIRKNTAKAIEMAGGAARLWPHVKTHKMAEMIDMQMSMGIRRFKCATISELKMAASRGAAELLLAYPLVGPNIARFLDAQDMYPDTRFYALGDSFSALEALNRASKARGHKVHWFVDVNMGMNRTGVPLAELEDFCRRAVRAYDALIFAGFHCYDGQNHLSDPKERLEAAEEQMAPILAVREALAEAGLPLPAVIAGGSPTFPCHAKMENAYLSPGTVFVWDWGYATSFPDLPFVPAAALLTRVVSHPATGVFTLDLGCKAIASDPAGQRGCLLNVPDAEVLFQSEEHWTWRMKPGAEDRIPEIGSVHYVLPTHICPTTALYRAVLLGEHGRVDGEWVVAARDR